MREDTVFNKNMNVIKNKYPDLYNRLTNSSEDKLDIQILEARDKNKYMRINNEIRTININSRYKPLDEAKKWVENIKISRNSKFVIFGFGFGYRIRELSNKMTNENSLLVIEPNIDIFKKAISNVDYSQVLKKSNLILVIGEEVDVVKKNVLTFTNWTNVKNVDFIYISNYEKLFNAELLFYIKIVKDIININIGNYNTIKRFNKLFYSNFIENIPHIVESINIEELFGKFQNKPAIIVSAGPSLAKNVELLKDIKNKALIICVGTALRVLLDKGIIPDLVITVDPHIYNYRHFENIEFDNIPLVYYSCVNPNILNEHKGEKFVFKFQDIYLGEVINNYMKDIEKLNSGGSVAHNALDLAIKMGADPIVFIGQDLAYTDDKTHSKGTIYENNNLEDEKENKKIVSVKDIYGNDIMTSEILYNYLRWFENVIEHNNDRTYIDATEGGAKIKGTNILTFKDTIEKYCTKDIGIKEIIKRMIDENKLNKIDITQLLVNLENLQKELIEIQNLCLKTEMLTKELIEKYDNMNDKEIIKKIKKIKTFENKLKSYVEGIKAIEFILNPILIDINNSRQNNDTVTLKEQVEISKLYFESINKCANTALSSIEELIENNFVRIMEFTINIRS